MPHYFQRVQIEEHTCIFYVSAQLASICNSFNMRRSNAKSKKRNNLSIGMAMFIWYIIIVFKGKSSRSLAQIAMHASIYWFLRTPRSNPEDTGSGKLLFAMFKIPTMMDGQSILCGMDSPDHPHPDIPDPYHPNHLDPNRMIIEHGKFFDF